MVKVPAEGSRAEPGLGAKAALAAPRKVFCVLLTVLSQADHHRAQAGGTRPVLTTIKSRCRRAKAELRNPRSGQAENLVHTYSRAHRVPGLEHSSSASCTWL